MIGPAVPVENLRFLPFWFFLLQPGVVQTDLVEKAPFSGLIGKYVGGFGRHPGVPLWPMSRSLELSYFKAYSIT